MNDVTTVVITHDRREQLLATLVRHEGPVVLVDNASTDGTADAVRSVLPHVHVVDAARNLGAAGRSLGVWAATTPYVAFSDDDSWWAPGALAAAAALLDAHARLGLVAGAVLVEPGRGPDPLNAVLAGSPLPRPAGAPGTPVLGFMACAAVVRRDAYLTAGGFHPMMGVGGEEELLAWDLAADGWWLQHVPQVVAHHEPRPGAGRGARRVAQLHRNAVVASLMRRPWRETGRRTSAAVRAGLPGWRGLASASRQVPRALRERHRLPADVEQQVALLRR